MKAQFSFVLYGGLLLWWSVEIFAQPAKTFKGVSLSPRSFQPADFTDFFEKAKQTGEVVMWAGDWIELSDTSRGGAIVVAALASTYNYIPLIEAQFFTQSTGTLLRPLDDSTKKIYKNSAAAFADKYKLKYFGLGIEVNTLYEKSPANFDVFVQFYSEVYDAVKAKSPATKVFTVFQLEKMKGLGGGLFGGITDTTKAQWSLLDRFPRSDIIAFTTYPGLIYKNPSEIPADYYTEVRSHTARPIAFTEIGWHSEASPTGWESSDAEQGEFVRIFFNRTRALDKELAIWSFMYDQNIIEPFKSMGLRRRTDGTAKPAWDDWITALTLIEREGQNMPGDLLLYQNYPNPFSAKGGSAPGGNPATTIRFALPAPSSVTLKLFDSLGREVATLVDDELSANEYKVVFKATDLPAGVYFYRLQADQFVQRRKLLLLK